MCPSKIFKVARHVTAVLGRNDAVEKRFDCRHICCFGAGASRIINGIATNSVTNLFWIGLFGAIGANDAHVRGDTFIWNVARMNKINGVRADWHITVGTETLRQASEFLGVGLDPLGALTAGT